MANYKNIHGLNIPIRASDPSNPVQGEIWYNSTSSSLKGQSVTTSAAWSSGGNLPVGRSALSGSGSTPAGFAMGGGTGPVASYVSATNTYNGTAWTAGGAMTHTAAYAAACGTIPTTIYAGGDGNGPGASNIYDGTAWTSIAALGFDGYQLKGAGDKANAFVAQGYYSAAGRTWDGSSWTTKSNVPQHNYSTSAVGTYNDASFLGGLAVSSGPGNVHLNWDGTSWNTRTVMPVSGGSQGQSSNGAPTSSFWVQATAPTTLNWDGSSWTTLGNLSTARSGGASSGSSSAEGFIAGGTGNTNITEEFIGAGAATTVTISSS